MGPSFKPPQDDAEFERRAKETLPNSARILIRTLRAKRAEAVKALDAEIEFYQRVLKFHGEEE